MKRDIIVVIVGFLIAILIGIVGFDAFVYYFIPEERKEIPNGIRKLAELEGVERIAALRQGLEHIDYPWADTTPEHLAEVLGSWERYEELRDSPLLKPIWTRTDEQVTVMQIGHDTPMGVKIYWVVMVLRGEVVKIEGRVITITNQGETISLFVSEWADIETDEIVRVVDEEGKPVYSDGYPLFRHKEAKFEDIKIGDWLSFIYVVINRNTFPSGEARIIRIGLQAT
jgi:hypothetical protein